MQELAALDKLVDSKKTDVEYSKRWLAEEREAERDFFSLAVGRMLQLPWHSWKALCGFISWMCICLHSAVFLF